jgi:hypothetical protein
MLAAVQETAAKVASADLFASSAEASNPLSQVKQFRPCSVCLTLLALLPLNYRRLIFFFLSTSSLQEAAAKVASAQEKRQKAMAELNPLNHPKVRALLSGSQNS